MRQMGSVVVMKRDLEIEEMTERMAEFARRVTSISFVNVVEQGLRVDIDRRGLLWIDRDKDGSYYVYAQALRSDYPVGQPEHFEIKPQTNHGLREATHDAVQWLPYQH
jgi:hypothetical protein